jgi:hypothetical protein
MSLPIRPFDFPFDAVCRRLRAFAARQLSSEDNASRYSPKGRRRRPISPGQKAREMARAAKRVGVDPSEAPGSGGDAEPERLRVAALRL